MLLAVGRHTRVPRRYRGIDIMWWLDAMGLLDRPVSPGRALETAHSLQLVGNALAREVDLPTLATRGIRFAGRLASLAGGVVVFAGRPSTSTTAAADAKLDRATGSHIDRFADSAGLDGSIRAADPAEGPDSRPLRRACRLNLEAEAGTAPAVIWATGYRRRYPWLHIPVLDPAGEIRQTAGRTPVSGLLTVGMQTQRRHLRAFPRRVATR